MSRHSLIVGVMVLVVVPVAAVNAEPETIGYSDNTTIIGGGTDGDICPGTVLLQQDDGGFENGYAWRSGGVVPPDYGAWAECYGAAFVCGIQFLFTQTGYYIGQTMDVYVWDSNAEGDPPPGPDPGNVICVLFDVAPGDIAFWPEISVHDVQICCDTGGSHFLGFWGNWPGQQHAWFIAADENGPGNGCPRTRVHPSGPEPEEGWQHPNVIASFSGCKDLGIREYAGLGDCQATPSRSTTWGRVKALF